MNRKNLEKLLSDIKMSETYAPEILVSYDQWQSEENCSEERARGLLSSHKIFADQKKIVMLLLYIILCERENGVWKRFPEDIFIDTMSDFTRYVAFYKEATGKEGFGKSDWPLNLHAAAKMTEKSVPKAHSSF